MSLSFNISAISFCVSSLLSAFIAWRAFLVWEREKENQVSEAFFKALLFFTLYLGVRGIVSFSFISFSLILTLAYILCHVFLGAAVAYLAKLGTVALFSPALANSIFIAVLVLYASDVILNILLPSHPRFNPKLNIIEWGTQRNVEYTGIYHTLLFLLVFLGTLTLFAYKAYQNWQNYILRTRCLLIVGGLLIAIFVTIPRNIFRTPVFLLISDISFVLTFGMILWGISFSEKREG